MDVVHVVLHAIEEPARAVRRVAPDVHLELGRGRAQREAQDEVVVEADERFAGVADLQALDGVRARVHALRQAAPPRVPKPLKDVGPSARSRQGLAVERADHDRQVLQRAHVLDQVVRRQRELGGGVVVSKHGVLVVGGQVERHLDRHHVLEHVERAEGARALAQRPQRRLVARVQMIVLVDAHGGLALEQRALLLLPLGAVGDRGRVPRDKRRHQL